MEMNGGLILEQKQMLSAKQMQSLTILAYTNQELEDFLMKEYLENPMLENTMDKENDMVTDVEALYEKGTSYRDQYLEHGEEDDVRRHDMRARSESDWKDSLLGQLSREDYTEKQWKLMEYLIGCLDPAGYFTSDLAELAGVIGCREEELSVCLKVLKELEPAGIFSKDLSECLKKQLEARGIQDEVLFALLDDYLTELMHGQIGVISRALGVPTTKIKEYIHLIGSLNPRPVMNTGSEQEEYVVPDIIISRHGDQWEISLNDNWMGEYKYNDYYIHMMESAEDPQLKEYFRERLERARFVVNCVEQRRQTVIHVVEAVLKLQEDYFLNGGALKPMLQEDVSQIAGIHVSTVSRAIKGKYIQYRKTVLLRSLFSAGVSDLVHENGASPQKIKDRIRSLIEEEGSRPHSDQKLAEMLEEEGIKVSRRAVAKYRIQMGIPDSRQRGLLR